MAYGIWNKDAAAWCGLGWQNTFTPFRAASAEQARDFIGRGAAECLEVRELTEQNLIGGLPYPAATKDGARVEIRDGAMAVIMRSDLPWEPLVFRAEKQH